VRCESAVVCITVVVQQFDTKEIIAYFRHLHDKKVKLGEFGSRALNTEGRRIMKIWVSMAQELTPVRINTQTHYSACFMIGGIEVLVRGGTVESPARPEAFRCNSNIQQGWG
jgi:hypothetical protein